MRKLTVPALLLAALAAGCESGNVLEAESTGAVRGVAFLDRNGNGTGEASDRPFRVAEVRLVTPGSGTVVGRATTDSTGFFIIPDVPIGRYQVTVAPESLADSVQMLPPPVEVSVPPQDTVDVAVGVTYPKVTVEEARTLPLGRRVFVEGTVVGAYADTAHLTGATRSIRATRLAAGSGSINPTQLPGDSVRILGVTARNRGQPTLDDALLFQLSSRVIPPPVQTNTGTAAAGGGGTLDAAQVQVRNAVVQDTFSVEGEWYLRLDDGSGPVNFWLGPRINFRSTGFVPGARVIATGVLAPNPNGAGWRIRWRRAEEDLVFVGLSADVARDVRRPGPG
ncbi:MAG TPA: hypothetical protein VHG51_01085 [Longimicrobiaceae bacterium]|nr:hypothetical protein [Longimicrobiaceae bacterium]